jgi:inositol transport system permease protein
MSSFINSVDNRGKINVTQLYNKFGIFIILLAMIVISSIISPAFLTNTNILNVLTQISVVTMIACGETMLIISGMIDLSPGAVVALSGCLCVGVYKLLFGLGISSLSAGILSVLIAIAVGIVISIIAAIIITKYDAPPFIVTLAMMTVARGLVLIYTNGQPIYNIGDIKILGQGRLGFLPIPVVAMITVLLISWILLTQTRFGRYLYAIGGNKDAAVASGIQTNKIIIASYLISGAFVGLAGIMYMTRINSGQPAEGVGLDFDAITAAIIGGSSFTGGIGTVTGTLCGAIIIGVLNNILNLMFVQSYYQQIIKGLIIVAAVVLDIKTKGYTKK